MTHKFLVVFEAGPSSYGALSRDIPSCFSIGETLDEARKNFSEAAEAHLEWIARDGETLPLPHTTNFEFGPDEPGDQTSAYTLERLPIRLPVSFEHAFFA